MRLYRQAMIGKPVSPNVKMRRDGTPVFKYDVRNDCVTLDDAARTEYVLQGGVWEVESHWNDLNGWEIRPPRVRRSPIRTSAQESGIDHPIFAKRSASTSIKLRAQALGHRKSK